MSGKLSHQTIATVKATVPALEAHGLDIVKAMYVRLFATPHIKALFNHSHQQGSDAQPKALTGAVLAYARYIDTPEVLAAALERIAQKHVSLQIDRGRGAGTFGVFDNARLRTIHDGDAGVGSAEVDTNDFGHVCIPFYRRSSRSGPETSAPGRVW